MNEVAKKEHTIVIGAGIVGVCCALNLQKCGFQVTIVDRNGVAQGCSKGNAGHFATEQVFPLAEWGLLPQLPKMLLHPRGPIKIKLSYLPKALPWFFRFLTNMLPQSFRRHTMALNALNTLAMGAYSELLEATGLSYMLLKKGSLLTFEHTDTLTIKRVQARYQAHGVNTQLLNINQARQLEPALSDNVRCAVFFPDVGHTMDPEKLCVALFECFLATGGSYDEKAVLGIEQHNDKVKVRTNSGTQTYDRCIVAAGAWSKKLLTPLRYKVPLDTERGYHLMLADHPPINRPITSFERKFIMTPMSSGLRLAGTVEFAGLDAKSNKKRAKTLAMHSVKIIKELKYDEKQEYQYWMGMRPSLPDSLPVIGQAPRHSQIYFAFGHQHLGLTQAAITGKILSDKIAGNPSNFDLSPYCISRFD